MAKTPEFLYHYTIGPKMRLIAESGALMPRGFGAAPREKAVLWLSENPQWEPTANKAISRDGGATFFRPTLIELQKTAGIFRFRLDCRKFAAQPDGAAALVPWTRIASVANIEKRHMADMVRRGMSWGATPMHWWGCMAALPMSLLDEGSLAIEARTPVPVGQQQQWTPVTMEEAIAAFQALGVRVAMTTTTGMPAARNI